MFDLKNGMSVIWDKGLKAKDISDVIKEIDEYSISCGYIENGIRIALFNPSKGSDGKMSVEHVFAESAIMMVLPGDLEGTLEGFDHPELLVAIEMGALKLLCLATEKDAIVASMEAKILKLKEMGISPEKVANMEAEEIIELRELLKLI
ncbi:MAG: hypothetical protein ACD_15C00068G0002 [uncultured bacterium]|nr:MAG: hypothetical protein ACD_15C00068G0002 [uncultured bacterium]